jgi:hypothetical protein
MYIYIRGDRNLYLIADSEEVVADDGHSGLHLLSWALRE